MSGPPRFADRRDAGRRLATAIGQRGPFAEPLVLGLARGGVPVAYEVAAMLAAPLDVFVVRKLGVPGQPELAMGAIASGALRVLNPDVVMAAHVAAGDIERVTARELELLQGHERAFGSGRPRELLAGRTTILVDDGLATGASMRAAIEAVRMSGSAAIVVAVPVAPAETCAALRELVDDLVCVGQPDPFVAVGAWYEDFAPVSDEEVRRLLG